MVKYLPRIGFSAVKLAVLMVIGLSVLPGSAHAGFFEDLFGGAQAPQAPTYDYQSPIDQEARHPVRRPSKKIARDDRPLLQKTTDIWHDRTLRDGDAVMMRSGLRVYSGQEGSRHVASDFRRVDMSSEISGKQKVALLAMDGTRNDPLTSGVAPDTIASGRSASVASPTVAGYAITDAHGKSVRYVGP